MRMQQISTMPELLGFLQNAGTTIAATQAAAMIEAATHTIYTGTSEHAPDIVRAFVALMEAYPPPYDLPLFYGDEPSE